MGELSRFIPIEINDTDIIDPYLNSNQPDIIFDEYTFTHDIEYLKELKRSLEKTPSKPPTQLVEVDVENISPEEVLKLLAKYCDKHGVMPAPLEVYDTGTFGGSFTNFSKLTIEDGKILLFRFAENARHLIKEQRSATPKEMRDSSEFFNGATSAGALHTSASEDENSMLEGRITGIFRIPIKDFLSYANDGKIILGNVGEREINLSGDIALQYLSEIKDHETGAVVKF